MNYKYSLVTDPANTVAPPKRRPFIDIELFGPSGSINITQALIDSGADLCLINAAYALEVGIDLRKCKMDKVVGIGGFGAAMAMYFTEVKIKPQFLKEIKIPVGFIESDSVNVLLGQSGFFDNYRIKFARDISTFEITPVKPK